MMEQFRSVFQSPVGQLVFAQLAKEADLPHNDEFEALKTGAPLDPTRLAFRAGMRCMLYRIANWKSGAGDTPLTGMEPTDA